MKILILNDDIPFPANYGGRIRTSSFVKSLNSNNELSFLCFHDLLPSDYEYKKYFRNVYTIKEEESKNLSKKERLCNLIKGIPWHIGYSYSSKFEKLFLGIIKNNKFDYILAQHVSMAQYLFRNLRKIKAKIVIDIDDIGPLKYERLLSFNKAKGHYERIRKFLDLLVLKRYYKNLNYADKCIVCSAKDKNLVERLGWSNKVSVIPNSVTVDSYKEVKDLDRKILGNKVIFFCGHLGYSPNVAGLFWFMKNCLPIIKTQEPNVKLHIVGSFPKEEVFEYVDNKSIFLFSNVPSTVPYYQDSSIVIIPIFVAGGTRIKILEALACRRPVISTSIGAEGLEIVDNKHCIIEDDYREFAYQCLDLLRNYDKASQLTTEGYKFVESNYDFKVAQDLIQKVFNS